jgi:hypothetical protein
MSQTSDTSETFETSEMKKCKVSHLLDEAIQGVGVGKELHDVTFLILDDAGECLGQIPAHKFVLSLDSVIFRWGFAHPGSLYRYLTYMGFSFTHRVPSSPPPSSTRRDGR